MDNGTVKEVIFALSSDVEGQATAVYLAGLLKDRNIKISRLAQGCRLDPISVMLILPRWLPHSADGPPSPEKKSRVSVKQIASAIRKQTRVSDQKAVTRQRKANRVSDQKQTRVSDQKAVTRQRKANRVSDQKAIKKIGPKGKEERSDEGAGP